MCVLPCHAVSSTSWKFRRLFDHIEKQYKTSYVAETVGVLKYSRTGTTQV